MEEMKDDIIIIIYRFLVAFDSESFDTPTKRSRSCNVVLRPFRAIEKISRNDPLPSTRSW
jgi:hypothetical protein